MALRVELHARARSDLTAIRDYVIKQASARSADRVRAHLLRKILRLAASPAIGTATSEPRVRILPPTRYPYRIYYMVTSDAVIVLHIRHSARRNPDRSDLTS